MSRVGIIGDTHVPYELDGYMEFCKTTFEQWGVDTVVHAGGVVRRRLVLTTTLAQLAEVVAHLIQHGRLEAAAVALQHQAQVSADKVHSS